MSIDCQISRQQYFRCADTYHELWYENLMIKIFGIGLLTLLFISLPAYSGNCADAYAYAEKVYTYAKRGSDSDDLDDAVYNAKRAMSAAEDAMSESQKCSCYDAYNAVADAFKSSEKAFHSRDINTAVYDLRKAVHSAEDAMSYAGYCGT